MSFPRRRAPSRPRAISFAPPPAWRAVISSLAVFRPSPSRCDWLLGGHIESHRAVGTSGPSDSDSVYSWVSDRAASVSFFSPHAALSRPTDQVSGQLPTLVRCGDRRAG